MGCPCGRHGDSTRPHETPDKDLTILNTRVLDPTEAKWHEGGWPQMLSAFDNGSATINPCRDLYRHRNRTWTVSCPLVCRNLSPFFLNCRRHLVRNHGTIGKWYIGFNTVVPEQNIRHYTDGILMHFLDKKMVVFWFKFYIGLFPKVQLITSHWFRSWLAACSAPIQ